MSRSNIVLIGMPGAGKSTVGVLLARTLKMPFIDTDILIQEEQNMLLQDIINTYGIEKLLDTEENTIVNLCVENYIIATGGSAIYKEGSMRHLKDNGIIIYLHLKLSKIERRIKNITTRGIAMGKGQSLADIYKERVPLYKKYADIEIDCSHKHIEDVISEIVQKIKR